MIAVMDLSDVMRAGNPWMEVLSSKAYPWGCGRPRGYTDHGSYGDIVTPAPAPISGVAALAVRGLSAHLRVDDVGRTELLGIRRAGPARRRSASVPPGTRARAAAP
jgi:hypothetical protein